MPSFSWHLEPHLKPVVNPLCQHDLMARSVRLTKTFSLLNHRVVGNRKGWALFDEFINNAEDVEGVSIKGLVPRPLHGQSGPYAL